jgi:hypothetical protein
MWAFIRVILVMPCLSDFSFLPYQSFLSKSPVGYKPKFRGVVQHFRFAPDSRRSSVNVRFHAD